MKRGKDNPEFTKDWRRQLRKDATPAEKEMWSWLRGRRFYGYHWYRQYGKWKYVLDFYCPIAKLAIELDGSIHNLLDNKTHDLDRTSYLESLGIRVLRFKNEQIFNDAENVKKAIPAHASGVSATIFRQRRSRWALLSVAPITFLALKPSHRGEGTVASQRGMRRRVIFFYVLLP